MQVCKRFGVVSFACLVLCLASTSASGITIKGNSSHGIGNGNGSWNVTSLLGSTTSLSYGGGSASVFSLGNGTYEQLACDDGSSCTLGDGTQIDVLFQIPASQIQGGTVTFNNFTFGSASGVQLLACDQSTSFQPGFLCSSGGLGLSVTNVSLVGTTLTFSGFPSGVNSFTFLLPYANTGANYSGPTLGAAASVPEPSSVILVGSGLLAGLFRRLKRDRSY